MSAAQPPQPPTGDGSGDDPFSWLYQRGQPAPSEDEPPLVPPTVQSPTPRPPSSPVPAYSPDPPAQPAATPVAPPPSQPPGPPPTYVLAPYQPGARSTSPATPSAPPAPEPPRRRGVLIGVIVGLVALAAVAAGIGVAFWLSRSPSAPDPVPQPSSAGSTAPARSGAAIVPTGVSADCTAPPATDDAGRRVSYDAGNVLDGDPNTAWRCDGEGEGKTLTFTFPAGTTISQVGLVNGYAKTDPSSGAKRYGEYRRITEVRWTFDGGGAVEQKLKDGTTTLQTTTVDDVAATRVVLTIEDSTKPGSKADTRDAVLISSVAFR